MIDMSSDVDGIADFLSCLANLERKNSYLFRVLSEKIDCFSVKPYLLKIADDNNKHASILVEISLHIGNSKVRIKECKKKLSVVCKNTEMILKKIKDADKVTVDELLDYLELLEGSGGAAQYLLVQAETFLFMSNEISRLYGMELSKFDELINEIVRDIEDHIEVLETIKHTLLEEQNKNQEKHPVFKYQNPDAWITPISGRED